MTVPLIIDSPVSAEVVIDGRSYINFAGSSYLGLSGRPEILEAGAATLRSTGAGYQISRQHEVSTRAHEAVEAEAAAFFGTPAALHCSVGYLFGLVAIGAIRQDFDAIFFDALAHHNLRDAIAASGLPSHVFGHLDVDDLAHKLRKNLRAGERPLIATDGMYSTFGEIAPVDALARAVEPFGGKLLVDESHSFGALGPTGRGACEHHQVPASQVVIGGSLTKAFGTSGGIIPGTEAEIAAFRATPAMLGSSAAPAAAAAMGAKALRHVREHPELLSRLRANVEYLKSGMRGIGLDVGTSIAPVAAFCKGSEQEMRALQRTLMAEGLFVLYSKYIGAGSAGVIRCGIFADHTTEQLDFLLDALRRFL